MADIKLKNRSGTDVTYSGVKTIQVPKADGTKEEFINPQGNINITDTQITDVRGKATAQVVDANLKAENIAKDVTVLGITGTHEGGGGGGMPFIYTYVQSIISFSANASTISCNNLPVNIEDYILSAYRTIGAYSTTAFKSVQTLEISKTDLVISKGSSSSTVKYTFPANGEGGGYNGFLLMCLCVPNTVVTFNEDGTYDYVQTGEVPSMFYTIFNSYAGDAFRQKINNAIISGTLTIQSFQFAGQNHLQNVKLCNVSQIGNNAFYNCEKLVELDLTACTSVPTLGSSVFIGTNDYYVVKVPSALYDEWIAATNWADISSHIVAV